MRGFSQFHFLLSRKYPHKDKERKAFYERVETEMSKKKARKLAFMRKVALVFNPLVA